MAISQQVSGALRDFRSRIVGASYEDTILAYLAIIIGASLRDMFTHWRYPERVLFDLKIVLLLGLAYIVLVFVKILRERLKALSEHLTAVNDLELEIMKQGKTLQRD